MPFAGFGSFLASAKWLFAMGFAGHHLAWWLEVISKSETKRRKQEKLDDYARIGVPEAWIVTPKGEDGRHPSSLGMEGKLTSTKTVVDGEIQPTQFPGVSIPVAEIWPD